MATRCQFSPISSGWSKTDPEGNPGLSIFHHCCHVGWVALELVRQGRAIPHSFISPLTAALIAAIHDVGKWSPGFLQMCLIWLEQVGLKLTAEREEWKAQQCIRHEKCSQDSIQLLLQLRDFKQSEAIAWAMIAGAHHGKMHTPENFGRCDLTPIMNVWNQQRHQIIESLESEFGCRIPRIGLKKSDLVVTWLMGLTSVADWIGSDENHFPIDKGLNKDEAKKYARMAVESIGIKRSEIMDGLDFETIFGFKANGLQKEALSVITEPGVYVIEAPMGMGKTEAALACTYGLLKKGAATGLYFALPTQLTSNRIHLRVSKFVKKITNNSDNTRLAHANAWLEESYYQPRPVHTLLSRSEDSATESRDWFASSKRGLIANFGVGTIDQALMAVVAVKHFFVRRFALSGKVIIIDEVHSYDHFTGTLIRCLCQELQQLGCTIIILSATLLPDARNDLIGIKRNENRNEGYPLITGRNSDGMVIVPQTSKPPSRPAVNRIFKSKRQLFKDALNAATSGARILWVCNTVNSSQQVFCELLQLAGNIETGLLHSRFPHFIRQSKEAYWMERLGKFDKSQKGCILVSTQIVEQSVDIDSDILISELAPMDMLLQRMGRLWRHLNERPATKRPVKEPDLWLVEEGKKLNELETIDNELLIKILGTKAKVYQPYVLLKTYETLHQYSTINLSDQKGNTDIRDLLRLTYMNHEGDPDSWEILSGEMKGTEYAETQLALGNTRLFARAALKDEEGKQTRLNEIETQPLIIATRIDKDRITLLNGDQIAMNPQKFNIHHARSIHQNVIRVHAWPYESVEPHPAVSYYIKGKHCLALLGENNKLLINGLKSGITMLWNEDMGVVQTINGGGDNESCD